MAKKVNPMLANLEASINAVWMSRLNTTIKMGLDAAIMAANEVLGLGAGRTPEFKQAYIRAMNTMSDMIMEDSKSDKELVYSKHTIDERLKQIVGKENFQPWNERCR